MLSSHNIDECQLYIILQRSDKLRCIMIINRQSPKFGITINKLPDSRVKALSQ